MFRYKSKYKKVKSFYISICKCFQFSLHYCILIKLSRIFLCLLDLKAGLGSAFGTTNTGSMFGNQNKSAFGLGTTNTFGTSTGSTGLFGNTAGTGLFGNTTGNLGFGTASSLQRGLGPTLGNSFGTSKFDIKCCCVYTIQNNKSTLAMIVCCIFSPRKYWNWFSKHVSNDEFQTFSSYTTCKINFCLLSFRIVHVCSGLLLS